MRSINNKKSRWAESDQAFGFLVTTIFLILFVRFYWQTSQITYLYLVPSVLFFLVSCFTPKILRPLKNIWMKCGEFAGKIITPFIMAFLFFVPLLLLSILMRLFGVRYMPLDFEKNTSYWIKREKNEFEDYSKQF